MARISILRRSLQVQPREGGGVREVVAVTYSTPAVPPRIVDLPATLYREATAEELAERSAYQMVPVGAEAVELERIHLRADMFGLFEGTPDSFEA